jgi:hypothetical protein
MPGVVAALVILAAAGGHVDSGARGVATIGPTCPVERPGDPGCRDKPFTSSLRILRARDRSLVKRFTPHADGSFVVHLVTGRYLIVKNGTTRLPSLSPVAVTVRKHRYTRVAVRLDSGIR